MVSFKAEVSTPFPSLRLDCCMQEGFHWGRDVWLDASHSPFSIPPTPHWLPVFPTLPGLELEEREEIRGTEKFLLDWYFLDSVNVSSETSIVTKSLSVENNCVSILAGCLLLPPAQLFSSRVQGSISGWGVRVWWAPPTHCRNQQPAHRAPGLNLLPRCPHFWNVLKQTQVFKLASLSSVVFPGPNS